MNAQKHRLPFRSLIASLLMTGLVACQAEAPEAADRGAPATVAATVATPVPAAAEPVIDPGDGGDYRPSLDPSRIADKIDNPYMPLLPGARWVYEGESEGEPERIEITVTNDRKQVMGISAYVIRDTVTVNGDLVEDTIDWFTQDLEGNVWYLGELAKDYKDGKMVSTAGSWEAGVGGALPGIVMPAAPKVGAAYRQEFLAGEAEDMMKVIALGKALTVPAGTFDKVLMTRDWTPLDPEVIEEKAYAPGTGKIREDKVAGGDGFVELVEFEPGS